jgi:hypothetical protein
MVFWWMGIWWFYGGWRMVERRKESNGRVTEEGSQKSETGGGNGILWCRSETTTSVVRTDITYCRGTRAFAIVEFKKRAVIKPAEFQAAVNTITAATPETTLASQAYARKSAHISFFDGDSVILMKQPSSYAIDCRTRYVALFNLRVGCVKA